MSGHADVVIVGGGAAGFFAARVLEELRPDTRIVILEKGREPLRKVAISGGGRCNVTHAQFDPARFAKHYPRGARELLGPLHRFGSREAVDWFRAHGVELKTEADGRIFPTSDDSASIVDCLRATRAELRLGSELRGIGRAAEGLRVDCADGTRWQAPCVLVAAGGSPRATHYAALESIGHRIESPVPSLFSFHVADDTLRGLSGLSVPQARLGLIDGSFEQQGPLLITHRGLSGPAALKLSAVAARELARRQHRFELLVRWHAPWRAEELDEQLAAHARELGRRQLAQAPLAPLPRRLWERLLRLAGIADARRGAELSREERRALVDCCCRLRLRVAGQSPNKDEFVTCGGVSLREVDFRSMESRVLPGLYLAGEILDVDALTGGFNFQAAWTTAWLAAHAIASRLGTADA